MKFLLTLKLFVIKTCIWLKFGEIFKSRFSENLLKNWLGFHKVALGLNQKHIRFVRIPFYLHTLRFNIDNNRLVPLS